MKQDVRKFLNPKSIAVVGASEDEKKVGGILMRKLSSFNGFVIPVNMKYDFIFGKKVYRSVRDYSRVIDLVIIATPAKTVRKILADCGKRKIKNVVIISAGFSEDGNIKEEKKISKLAKKHKINLLGPNCFGVANPYINLDATFSNSSPKKGKIAFISQSGALWSYISDLEIGFSGFVSLGNMADLSFTDFIEYFNRDKNTKRIFLYIEKLKEGRNFIEVCRKSKKEIVVVKAGKSEEGRKAVLSHTGSLATDFRIYQGAFKQARIKSENSVYRAAKPNSKAEEFVSAAGLENKVVILTNAGGAGALMSDLCKERGFEIIKMPSEISKTNPVDLLGTATAKDYSNMLDKLKKKNFYDKIIVILTPQYMSDPKGVAEEILKFPKKEKIIACFLGKKSIEKAVSILKKGGIKIYTHCC